MIIYYDQVKFKPVIQEWFKIHKLISMICHIHEFKDNNSSDNISRCRKNPLTKIQCSFMIKVMGE